MNKENIHTIQNRNIIFNEDINSNNKEIEDEIVFDPVFAENALLSESEYEDNIEEKEKEEIKYKDKDINFQKYSWSILDILKKINNGDLNLNPDFQRKEIWKKENKIAFIESIFLNFLIPPIYVAVSKTQNKENKVNYDLLNDSIKFEIVDGKQRLSAIKSFFNSEFKLEEKYLLNKDPKYKNMKFSELDENTKINFLDSFIIDFFAITSSSDPLLKYDVFARLNRGSEVLSENEIRRAIYNNDFVQKISDKTDTLIKNNDKNYLSIFSKKTMARYSDLGIFFRHFAFVYRCKKEENKFIYKGYNSRPKEFINLFLDKNNTWKENDDKIFNFIIRIRVIQTEEIKAELKEKNITFRLLIDNVVTFYKIFYEKNDIQILGFINSIIKNSEYLSTFEKSVNSTNNINNRLNIFYNELQKYDWR